MITIKDEGVGGSILLPSISTPDTTKSKLYNVGGQLHWDGVQLGTVNQAGGWRVSGLNIYPANLNSSIGIGTSSPLFSLQVEGNTTGDVSLGIHNRNNAGSERLYFGELTNSDAGILVFGSTSPTNTGKYRFLNNKTGGHFDWVSGSKVRMTLDNRGWLSIGNDSPTQKLDVGGKLKIADDTTSAAAGVMRYNSSSKEFEGFDGGTWTSFGGGRWLANGSHIYYNAGNAALGTSTPTAKFHIIQGTANDAFRVNDAVFDSSPFIIKDDGKVGIGTETPGFPLEVLRINPSSNVHPVATFKSVGDNSSGAIRLEGSNSHFWTVGTTQHPANAFAINYDANISIGSDLLTVTPAGRLGIGAIAPLDKLHVVGDARIEDTTHPILQFYNDDTYAGFTGTIGTDMHISNNQAGYLYLKTKNTSRLTIDSSGFVGVGTSTPEYPFHAVASNIDQTAYFEIDTDTDFASGVYGSGSGTGPVAGTYGRATGDSINYGMIGLAFNGEKNYGGKFTSNTSISEQKGFGIHATATGSGTNYAGFFEDGDVVLESGDFGLGILEPTARAHILQDVSGVNAFRVDDATGDTSPFVIDDNGNVGIGTESPQAKLDISGNALAGGVGIGTFPTIGKLQIDYDPFDIYLGYSGGRSFAFFSLLDNGNFNETGTWLTRKDEGNLIEDDFYYGVYGLAVDGSGGNNNYGVYGRAEYGISNYGVYGSSGYNANDWAGYFSGKVKVTDNLFVNDNLYVNDTLETGHLIKSSGTFKIDHPLDPENKYLYHSFVESPDMKNIYDGNVILNEEGRAVVQMPDWFDALNKDFRYQLTAMGVPGPGLYVAEEINGNQFTIAGGTPSMKVSWQVTGVRQDAYANMNRIKVEEDKAEADRGTYLHPEAFGKPETMKQGYDLNKIHN